MLVTTSSRAVCFKLPVQEFKINTQARLIGIWNLLEHSEINESLRGTLIYSSDNKMSVHITGKTDGAEILISYSGIYYLENNFVIHKVEISDNPKRIGVT